MTYVLDSNIISFLLRGDEKVREVIFGLLKNSHEMRIPLVAYYEVKRGLLKKDAKKKILQFRDYCNSFGVLGITERTMDIASDIYAALTVDGNIIEDADIFIAATAIEHDFTLLTNNTDHMKRVKDLRFMHIEK